MGIGLCSLLVAQTSTEEGFDGYMRGSAAYRSFDLLDYDEKPCEWSGDCYTTAQYLLVYCIDVGIDYLSLQSTHRKPVKGAFAISRNFLLPFEKDVILLDWITKEADSLKEYSLFLFISAI